MAAERGGSEPVEEAVEGEKCGAVPFSEFVDVMGFGDIATSCSADTVDEVVDCITAIECTAWEIARYPEARISGDTPAEYLSDYLACP